MRVLKLAAKAGSVAQLTAVGGANGPTAIAARSGRLRIAHSL
jgi:hypothetical protein